MKKIIILFVLITLACILAGCAHQKAIEIAPSELLGMEKKTIAVEERALESVERMHIGRLEYMEDVAIFKYEKEGKSVILWVTTYSNSTVAQNETERMVQAMLNFRDWGVNLQESEVEGKHIYCLPRGDEMHYFWEDNYCMFYFVSQNLNSTEIHSIIESVNCDQKWI
ncbi:MAG: hypothetical protein ACLFVI_07385 [Archaeoglobaceae archaeon]